MTKQSFHKNQLVKVPAGTEWIRLITPKEVEQWRQSPESKGMDCAGETKLLPMTRCGRLAEDTVFVVTRARTRFTAYGYVYAGRIEVMNTATGEIVTFDRRLVQPLS